MVAGLCHFIFSSWCLFEAKRRQDEKAQSSQHTLVFVSGGRVAKEESLSSVERYDPSRDRWDEVAPLSRPRRCVAVASHGGRLYAVGGSGIWKICLDFMPPP